MCMILFTMLITYNTAKKYDSWILEDDRPEAKIFERNHLCFHRVFNFKKNKITQKLIYKLDSSVSPISKPYKLSNSTCNFKCGTNIISWTWPILS